MHQDRLASWYAIFVALFPLPLLAAVPPRATERVTVTLPDVGAELRAFEEPTSHPVPWWPRVVNAGWGGGNLGDVLRQLPPAVKHRYDASESDLLARMCAPPVMSEYQLPMGRIRLDHLAGAEHPDFPRYAMALLVRPQGHAGVATPEKKAGQGQL